MGLGSAVAVLLAMAFAFAMGAHYTGACMGMAYATGAIAERRALRLMAVLALVGAAFLSHGVLDTVGYRIVGADDLTPGQASATLAAAFLLTTLYNRLKLPTSTIQIFVFCMAGVALAGNGSVNWSTIGHLVALWALAPLAAAALGFGFTRLLDRLGLGAPPSDKDAAGEQRRANARRMLLLAAATASLAMGANDVANATGVLVAALRWPALAAGALGGVAIALGVVGWGGALLKRVAFEIARLDLAMAGAAQMVQALVVLASVLGFGYFTSINQALVGAIGGAGLARGLKTVNWATMAGIVVGWVVGPLSALALGYGLSRALHLAFPA